MSTKYLSCADTAKLVRKALKAAFPGVKFSVRSDTYSGGASIRVRWVDGPTAKQVEAVTEQYRGADFDGMQDLKTYRTGTLIAFGADTDSIEEVKFGADFIFCERALSDEYLAELEPVAVAVIAQSAAHYRDGFDADRWYDSVPCEWGIFRGGQGRHLVRYLADFIAPSNYTA